MDANLCLLLSLDTFAKSPESIEDNKLLMFSGSQKIIIGKDSNFISNSNISLLGNYFEYK